MINECYNLVGQKCILKKNRILSPGRRWRAVLRKLKLLSLDPWKDFQLQLIPTLTATRHRYSVLKKKWHQDEIFIKLEATSFNHGAMRECFRMKKMPINGDWQAASNYVAKRYIYPVNQSVYFADVHLQMEAKLWGESFNRQNPPKKVDIFQMSLIELTRESGVELYHIERFMEGEYRKYNSNSGFVDENLRNTPHAFSHFTFERSGHRLMVVDIQGVGDLYTDPQIHTHDGQGYNDGNLGIRGMALFFHSHHCNPLCVWLGLTPFDLSPSEEEATTEDRPSDFSAEASPGRDSLHDCYEGAGDGDERLCISPKPADIKRKPLRKRSISYAVGLNGSPCSGSYCHSQRLYGPTVVRGDETASKSYMFASANLSPAPFSPIETQTFFRPSSALTGRLAASPGHSLPAGGLYTHSFSTSSHDLSMGSPVSLSLREEDFGGPLCEGGDHLQPNGSCRSGRRRTRYISESSDMDDEEAVCLAASQLHQVMHESHKPSCATHPSNLDQEIGQSILGQIHHDMARLHETGRFAVSPRGILSNTSLLRRQYASQSRLTSTSGDVDWESVLFHERHAAQLGCLEAIIVMAHYHLSLPTQLLSDCPIQPHEEDSRLGMDYLWRACEGGDRRCMILMARYLDASIYFGCSSAPLSPSQSAVRCALNLLTTPLNAYLILLSQTNFPALTGTTASTRPWLEAVFWYQRAVHSASLTNSSQDQSPDEGFDAEGRYDAAEDLFPVYRLQARMAEMYLIGGHGLDCEYSTAGDLFTSAAELAMNLKEGRLAAKYFELAEEAYSKVE